MQEINYDLYFNHCWRGGKHQLLEERIYVYYILSINIYTIRIAYHSSTHLINQSLQKKNNNKNKKTPSVNLSIRNNCLETMKAIKLRRQLRPSHPPPIFRLLRRLRRGTHFVPLVRSINFNGVRGHRRRRISGVTIWNRRRPRKGHFLAQRLGPECFKWAEHRHPHSWSNSKT